MLHHGHDTSGITVDLTVAKTCLNRSWWLTLCEKNKRPSAVFGGGIVQWLLWMTVREPRLRSHDSTPAVWGTAWSLTFPGTWCRCCFIFLRVPAEKSLEHLHLFSLTWPTSSKKETNWHKMRLLTGFRVCSIWMLDSDVRARMHKIIIYIHYICDRSIALRITSSTVYIIKLWTGPIQDLKRVSILWRMLNSLTLMYNLAVLEVTFIMTFISAATLNILL